MLSVSSKFCSAFLLLITVVTSIFFQLIEHSESSGIGLLGFSCLSLTAAYLVVIKFFGNSDDPEDIRRLCGAAVISRLIFVFSPILFTGDIYRYLWEGFLVRSGVNPYAHAPETLVGLGYQVDFWSKVEHAHLSAIYPPFAELILGFFCLTPILWKLFIGSCDALTIYLLWMLMRRLELPIGRVLYYAWLPLASIETAISGHLDGIQALLLVLFLLLLLRPPSMKKSVGAPVIAACGILTKYIFALPLLLLTVGTIKQGRLRFWIGTIFVSAIITLPFIGAGAEIFSSLSTYLSHWRHNDSALHLLGWVFGADWERLETFRWIKLTLLGVWVVATCVMIKKKVRGETLLLYSIALFILLGPVFHPWYALWFAPLLCLVQSRALIYLCALLPISYYARLTGQADLPYHLKLLEFVPVYLLLIYEYLQLVKSPPSDSELFQNSTV